MLNRAVVCAVKLLCVDYDTDCDENNEKMLCLISISVS